MGKPVGIGILGCGSVATFHADAIQRIEDLRLVAVCDQFENSACRLGERLGVPYYTSVEALLGNPAVEAVTICTPSGTHAELGCPAARSGRHVLVEKPIDVSLRNADALIAACDAAGVRLAVALQSRFLDAPRAIKSAVDEGRLGRPIVGSAYIKWYRSAEYYGSSWRGTLALDGGGALINQAVHTVDLLRWIMGPVADVSAYSGHLLYPHIEGEDTVVAALRFESGAVGVIEAATSVYPGFRRRLELTGSEGTIVLDGDHIDKWALRDGSANPMPAAAEVSDGSSDPMAIDSEGHRRVLEDFARAIREGRAPQVDGLQGRQALELVTAIYDAAARAAQRSRPAHK